MGTVKTFQNKENLFLKTLRAILNYIVVFSVFCEALSLNFNLAFEIRLSHILLCLLLVYYFLLHLKAIALKTYNPLTIIKTRPLLTATVVLIAVVSFLNCLRGENAFGLFFKQVTGLLLYGTGFYVLLRINNYDVKRLFKMYFNIAFFVAAAGVTQELFYVFNTPWIFDFSDISAKWQLTYTSNLQFIKINSVLPEPASFCLIMFPAFFYAINSFASTKLAVRSKFQCFIIIAAYLFSFSLIGYIGIFLSAFLLLLRRLKTKTGVLLCLAVMFSASFFFYTIPDFHSRIIDTFEVFSGKKDVNSTNTSSYTLLISTTITAKEALENIPSLLFGNGLGSYEVSYFRHIHSLGIDMAGKQYLNTKDASALSLRLVSETGLIGLFIFLGFAMRYFLFKVKDPARCLWIINNGIFILILLRLLRQGNYFSEGFFFFLWLYYYSFKQEMKTQK